MDGRLLVPLFCLSLLCPEALVGAEFVLTVNFINYTNPTGLCAECETRLESVTRADQLVPVCCDDFPITSVNCDNIAVQRCDTRFRWTIRPFGASLETRPVTIMDAAVPPYYFTDCDNRPGATCPFSEMSTTFSEGPAGFLGVAPNPLPVVPRNMTSWMGRVQFFIEAVDSGLPNIIDSLLINLDSLQLGADFTEEMTFTGYHNISHMTMSFRVECAAGFCGSDCTTVNTSNVFISSCQTNGEIVCVSGRDPDSACSDCLSGRNITTNCTTCLSGYSGENCTRTPDPPGVVGPVVGGVVGVAIVAVIVGVAVVLVVLLVRRSHKSRASQQAKSAVNHTYEATDTDPATLGDLSLKKSSTGVSTLEHDFDNPLYATRDGENDYSSPWDTRETGSNNPVVVASSISSHAVVMRVNSNEPSGAGSRKSSRKKKQADVDHTPKPLPPQAMYDYADPPNNPPQPVYDTADHPPPARNAKSANAKVVPYQCHNLPGFSNDKDERMFDNTGEDGVYRSYSPSELPPLARQHYDLGQGQ